MALMNFKNYKLIEIEIH